MARKLGGGGKGKSDDAWGWMVAIMIGFVFFVVILVLAELAIRQEIQNERLIGECEVIE